MQLSIKLIVLSLMAAYVTAQDTTGDPDAYVLLDLFHFRYWLTIFGALQYLCGFFNSRFAVKCPFLAVLVEIICYFIHGVRLFVLGGKLSQRSNLKLGLSSQRGHPSYRHSNSGVGSSANGIGGGSALALVDFVVELV